MPRTENRSNLADILSNDTAPTYTHIYSTTTGKAVILHTETKRRKKNTIFLFEVSFLRKLTLNIHHVYWYIDGPFTLAKVKRTRVYIF